MPSKKPKISAYVSQVVKERLTEFSRERKVSESQAVTIILAEYFELKQVLNRSEGVEIGGVTLSRLEALEKKLENLISSVDQRFQELGGGLLSNSQVDYQENKTVETLVDILPELEQKISSHFSLPIELPEKIELNPIPGTKLSKLRFGLGESSIASAKRKQSTEKFTEWTKSKDPDGIAWKFVEKPTKGYLPAESLPEELMVKLLEWVKENNL